MKILSLLQKIQISSLYKDLQRELSQHKKDKSRLLKSRDILEKALQDGNAYYGINTGFGALASKRIAPDQVTRLQKNLLLSHAVGVGPVIPKAISRIMLMLKIHTLALGHSGVSERTFDRLLYFHDQDLIPAIPSKGSLGASGDLAPLAHMSLPLLGYGEFWDNTGEKIIPAADVLKQHQLKPINLQAKDGLALVNGTQLMAGYGAYILEKMQELMKMADLVSAMSLEALQGSLTPFDKRIHALRPHQGQMTVAGNIRKLLAGSEILESHRNCGKVQDPYCLRCIPQVHGASRDAIGYAITAIETEMNSVNDNPLVMENGEIISGGNFHGQPLALALDFAAIALAELGSISERRTYLLLDGHDGLPKLLMRETGINSGFMIPQYTAAALVSENKILCHPASVDSIPSSLGQEDHVSMGSISALKLLDVYRNLEHILSVELLTAAQALDFREPLIPGIGVKNAHQYLRGIVPHSIEDRYMKEDIDRCLQIVRKAEVLEAAGVDLN
ncbi:MAG: histidine ammonia-lyase [Balneolales bacterium]